MKSYKYVRYVDDFIVIGKYPNLYLYLITAELNRLKLKLATSKTIVDLIRIGLDFVGAEIKPFRRKLRTKTFNHAVEMIKYFSSSSRITSYIALAFSHGNYRNILDFCRLALKSNHFILMSPNRVPRVRLISCPKM